MGPIRSPSGESARHEDAQKRLISATAAAQKRRVGGLAYESPAALRGWRSGEQAGTCSAVLGAAGESRERGRGWPPRAAKAKYRTIFSTGEATRRSNGPGQPREAAPRKSRKPRNALAGAASAGQKQATKKSAGEQRAGRALGRQAQAQARAPGRAAARYRCRTDPAEPWPWQNRAILSAAAAGQFCCAAGYVFSAPQASGERRRPPRCTERRRRAPLPPPRPPWGMGDVIKVSWESIPP